MRSKISENATGNQTGKMTRFVCKRQWVKNMLQLFKKSTKRRLITFSKWLARVVGPAESHFIYSPLLWIRKLSSFPEGDLIWDILPIFLNFWLFKRFLRSYAHYKRYTVCEYISKRKFLDWIQDSVPDWASAQVFRSIAYLSVLIRAEVGQRDLGSCRCH